jgi:ATP-dependent helicase/nuclease subunit A
VRTGLEGLAKSEEFDFSGVLPDLTGEGLRLDGAQEAAPDRAEDTAKRPVPEIDLEGWETVPPVPEPAPPRPLTPSDTGEEPPTMGPIGPGGADRFLKGRLVHALLQYLPGLAPEIRRAAAERYLAVPAHGLDDAAQAEIAAETLAVIEDQRFSALFAPGSLAEVPVTGAVGGVVIAGQVDRLAVTADRVLVVDYKTNRPVPVGPEDVPLAYLRQMARYRAVLDGIFPGRRIDCALVFTAGPKLVSLPAELLANAAAEGLLDGSPAHP